MLKKLDTVADIERWFWNARSRQTVEEFSDTCKYIAECVQLRQRLEAIATERNPHFNEAPGAATAQYVLELSRERWSA